MRNNLRSSIASNLILLKPLHNYWEADPSCKTAPRSFSCPSILHIGFAGVASERNHDGKRNSGQFRISQPMSSLQNRLYRTLMDNRIVSHVHFPVLSETSEFLRSNFPGLTSLP